MVDTVLYMKMVDQFKPTSLPKLCIFKTYSQPNLCIDEPKSATDIGQMGPAGPHGIK